jgi:hypothetical protein
MVNPRSAANRIGALALHASHDPRVTSFPGRQAADAGLNTRLLAEIDARDPSLPEQERERRLQYARRMHFSQLARRSARVRQQHAQRRNGGGS